MNSTSIAPALAPMMADFIRQIQDYHRPTPTRAAYPLHYDTKTQALVEFPWPYDPESGQRIAPDMLEAYQKSHEFRAPCCLCAFIEGKAYSKSEIGIVDGGRATVLTGQYVALCSSRRCGYFVCLEWFYTMDGLMLQTCRKRDHPLPSKESAHFSDSLDLSRPLNPASLTPMVPATGTPKNLRLIKPAMPKKAMEELFWDLAHGVSWETFASTFAQCLVCKAIVLREGMFSQHRCGMSRLQGDRPAESVSNTGSMVRMRVTRVNGRLVRLRVGTGEPGDPFRTYSPSLLAKTGYSATSILSYRHLREEPFLLLVFTVALMSQSIHPNPLHFQAHSSSYCCDHCGKEYSALHHLEKHERSSCLLAKRNLSDLLEESKAYWESRKRRKVNCGTDEGFCEGSSLQEHGNVPPADLHIPVGIRKGKRPIRHPARYDDANLPIAPATLQDAISHAASSSLPAFNIHAAANPVLALLPSLGGFEPTHDPDQLVFKPKPTKPAKGEDCQNPNTEATNCRDPDTEAEDRRGPNSRTEDRRNLNAKDQIRRNPKDSSFGPFSSRTAFLLAEWYWQSSRKSLLDFQNLMSILKDPQFSLPDATNVNWKATFQTLGANKGDLPEDSRSWIHDDGWKTETISIDIPFHNRMPEPGIKTFTVGKFHHRSLVSVIKEKVSSAKDTPNFHYYPYEAAWKPTGCSPEVNLYGELYASHAFREAHEAVQRQPRTERDKGLERVVVALMFWSDATQLTAFGGAGLWPCYMFFGNESKHRRGEPSAKLGQQVAYFMKLPDRVGDFLKERNKGRLPAKALLKYLARELFHKQWTLVCGIRNNGGLPCHRCLVKQADLCKLGSPSDTERLNQLRISNKQKEAAVKAQGIIRDGCAFSNDKVKSILGSQCLVPVQTAFDSKIPETHPLFDILGTLVVDVLHEFEIGVWKKTFYTSHSVARIVQPRYRSVPPFARDTIRKFPLNVSEMKAKGGSRLRGSFAGKVVPQSISPPLTSNQCAIPTFEGLLLEEHNARLMELLFVCAQWHALAKLRQHNDHTLGLLDYTTVQLGAKMRIFCRDTCSKISTKETQKEADARAKKAGKNGQGKPTGSAARRPVTLDVFTIKFHFLGDYSSTIRRVGTTDSFSTQTGELYHRFPKSWYPRTDRKDYELQLTHMERRQARLSDIRASLDSNSQGIGPSSDARLSNDSAPPGGLGESLLELERHYIIGANQNTSITFNALADRSDWGVRDPYLVGFHEKLKRHLLPRILEKLGYDKAVVAAGADQWPHVAFKDNRIYSHQLLKMNYTTYDVRRNQDIIHVGTPQCNVMFLNPSYTADSRLTEHPYLYGKILGVFHADVCFVGQLPNDLKPSTAYHRIDVVWVNWYKFLPAKTPSSLDRLSLYPLNLGFSLNFTDPDNIIRGIHLIPQFSSKQEEILPKSKFTGTDPVVWDAYFINRFVDRDMFMRYQYGMSVGHAYMLNAAFPGPQVPVIPHDFDHCLIFKPASSSASRFAPATSTHEDTGHSLEQRSVANEGPSTSSLEDEGHILQSQLEREAPNPGRDDDNSDGDDDDDGGDDDDDDDDDDWVRHDDDDDDDDDDGDDDDDDDGEEN
ncbi:hypothetical protein FA13DRAFT_1721217 [Coprinellus micaceus]|uniref:C2H2-type domain-containing protein n=1 Tax=Coprinellus micaceus TaxID=71717 RepID=A0A4Y7S2J8_COPMI|nr:hypothetical protein FA13DRAFT_1721217 [Coprinellus micaceus]